MSLLTNFEKANDAFDWEIGKHGIIIELEEGIENYDDKLMLKIFKMMNIIERHIYQKFQNREVGLKKKLSNIC